VSGREFIGSFASAANVPVLVARANGGRAHTRKTPPQLGWRFWYLLRWPLASQVFLGGGYIHRTYCRLPRPVSLFRAASMAVALAGCLLFFGLAGLLSSSRIITGTLPIAIGVPISPWFVFSRLASLTGCSFLHYGRPSTEIMQKTIECLLETSRGSCTMASLRCAFAGEDSTIFAASPHRTMDENGLALALRAVVSPPPGDNHPPDWGLAAAARLAGAQVDAMLQLKEAAYPVGVNII